MSRKKSVELAKRIKDLPPYLFATIDKMKQKAISSGVDLIDLSVGDPDIPTPKHVVERMKKAVQKPKNHQYPSYEGMPSFRQAVAGWYKKRFRVSLDPETEIISLIGSKEGIGHLPLAFINPGDVVLVPSPGYPVYPIATLFAGGKSYIMPLVKENKFLPDLKAVPKNILKKTKLMFLNYPNNPTAAVAGKKFFSEVIKFARKNNIVVCHDAAYSEIYFDGKRPISFLQVPGARDVGIEVHSLSKTYNMTGWRIGFAAGSANVIASLGKIKSNLDSGVFQAVQEAGIEALNTSETVLRKIRDIYQERREIFYNGLKGLGLEVEKPRATFYFWTKVPEGYDSSSFVSHLLNKAGVLITPGNGFGGPGEGYVRFSLTVPAKKIRQAISRIKKIL